MINELEAVVNNQVERDLIKSESHEYDDLKEISKDLENENKKISETPDVAYIERTNRLSLLEECTLRAPLELDGDEKSLPKLDEFDSEFLSDQERTSFKTETGWSDAIIDNISKVRQCEILLEAGLIEVEIDGRTCLIKENIDLDYTDEDGISNRDRMERGAPPLDDTGKPIELHHLGQKVDSPLVELTESEHRTGDYINGKKNQSLWHDSSVKTEVHGEGNNWEQERKAHWIARIEE